jgi:ABC-type cobalamin transport system ATPase subunit
MGADQQKAERFEVEIWGIEGSGLDLLLIFLLLLSILVRKLIQKESYCVCGRVSIIPTVVLSATAHPTGKSVYWPGHKSAPSTAVLDARAEFEVFQCFAELTEGKSAVLISHRFSTVRMADRILVLENGQALEIGSHEELLALNGRYAELFALQARGYQ